MVRVRTQSPVAFAISSPTFLGERPRGPILGASADEAPTSPPVARRWMIFSCGRAQYVSQTRHLFVPVCIITYLIGVELGRCMAQVSCQQGEEPMLERAILTHG